MITRKTLLLITIITVFSLLSLFLIEPPKELFYNYTLILRDPSILLTDYIAISSFAATLFNVITIVYFNILVLYYIKQKFNGPIIACLFTIAGFAFFGKNIFNSIPIYIGIYIYSKVSKTEFKSHIIALLLSTGISPIVSYLLFGLGLNYFISIPLAVSTGALIGYIIPAFNPYSLRFHQGNNLYSIGFSIGVLSMIVSAIIQSLNGSVDRVLIVSTQYHNVLFLTTLIMSLMFIIIAFIMKVKKDDYVKILKEPGNLITDFTKVSSISATILNLGIMGFISLIVVLVLKININGPIFGAILTVIGFGAFGKHPLNTVSIMLGAIIAVYITPVGVNQGTILAIFFVTGLAPVAGNYGMIAGFIVGFVHVLITPFALEFQGGFDLYNNGFAAGFVAAVFVPLFASIKRRMKNE